MVDKPKTGVIPVGKQAVLGIGTTAVAAHRTSFMTVHIRTDTPQRPYRFISFGRAREFPIVFVPESVHVEASQSKKTVALKNPRETALMIQTIKGSQKWIQPVLRSENIVYPWRAADIELNFDTERMPTERFNEKLTVEYIDHKGEIRNITLRISGEPHQTYTLTPDRFFFGQIDTTEANTKVLVFSNLTGTEIQIEKVEADVGTVEIKQQEDNNRYHLTLTLPQALAKGTLKGEVRLQTNHPKMRLIKIPIFAFVTNL